MELPIAVCLPTVSPGIRIKVDLGTRGKGGTGAVFDVWVLGSIHRMGLYKTLSQDRRVEMNSIQRVSSLLIRNQAKDMIWFSDAQSVPERTPCTSLFSLVEKQMGTQTVKPLFPCRLRAWRRLARKPRPGCRKKRTTRGKSDFSCPDVTWQVSEDTFPWAFPIS